MSIRLTYTLGNLAFVFWMVDNRHYHESFGVFWRFMVHTLEPTPLRYSVLDFCPEEENLAGETLIPFRCSVPGKEWSMHIPGLDPGMEMREALAHIMAHCPEPVDDANLAHMLRVLRSVNTDMASISEEEWRRIPTERI